MINNVIGKIAKRFLFFLVSSILCFLLTEFALNYFLKPYSLEKKYERINAIGAGNAEFIQKDRHENIYETFNSSNNQIQIVTIGDSYTNGGNVKWHNTYPFNLFLNLDQQYTVLNMGLCEDTTAGVYSRIKKYLNENHFGKKIFVVLVGAADMFIESNVNMEDIYDEAAKTNAFLLQNLEFKGSNSPNFLEKFKTYKMIKYVLFRLKTKILNMYYVNYKKTSTASLNSECFDKDDDSRNFCLQEDLKNLTQHLTQNYDKKVFKHLIQQIIQINSSKKNAETHIVEDLLLLGSSFPKVLAVPGYIFNIVTYTSRQSKLSLGADVLPFLKKTYASEKEFIENQNQDQNKYYTTKSFLNAADAWNLKTIDNQKIQVQHFESLIKLIKSHGSKLIIMTYPLNYRVLNQTIRQLSKKNSIPVIDLEKKFEEAYDTGTAKDALIGDWEHCTPKGYKLIAELVESEVRKLLPISK